MFRPGAAGQAAEQLAADYLEAQGLHLRARNVRRPYGELDLVALEGETLVLVEVRKRSHPGFGGGAESIDRRKQDRLLRVAEAYLQESRWTGPVRFDVVTLDGANRIEWLQDAIQGHAT
ncbi:YraN family protein [Thioalkalivibrio sp. ALJ16]|uniref:YraN family protein n=1 Tax=Thioalkalivibrio sp. ALJ16 TaxID=1158762 RepID=UPI0003786C16|nr:YraN family protein [Thioalkalivibrio sp. ALJ16]